MKGEEEISALNTQGEAIALLPGKPFQNQLCEADYTRKFSRTPCLFATDLNKEQIFRSAEAQGTTSHRSLSQQQKRS